MSDEYTVCAAAFFRCKGTNIITRDQFIKTISIEKHWMNYKSAGAFLKTLLSKGILIESGETIKPAFNISDVEVPVAYRPSEAFIKELSDAESKPAATKAPAVETATEDSKSAKGHHTAANDLLPTMIQKAVETGMEKRDFIAEANSISKRLNIDMLVAGLLILRDKGANIDSLADRIYDSVTSR